MTTSTKPYTLEDLYYDLSDLRTKLVSIVGLTRQEWFDIDTDITEAILSIGDRLRKEDEEKRL